MKESLRDVVLTGLLALEWPSSSDSFFVLVSLSDYWSKGIQKVVLHITFIIDLVSITRADHLCLNMMDLC
jgi:hypothetical protein